MWELVRAGGWVMIPILLCSLGAVAIVAERLWSLRRARIVPAELMPQVQQWIKSDQLNDEAVLRLRRHSPLGKVLAAGLASRHLDRAAVKESIEDAGRHEVHELERYLNTLGTIAGVTPLLGLLGTVFGMIRMFSALTSAGVGNPADLAHGIAEALITTAAGLIVAIPALAMHRYLRGWVADIVVEMEAASIALINTLYGGGFPATPSAPRRRSPKARAVAS
ncbi:MAG: MotA/TolQ/ExbB proton channel family protein [Pseudomonadota bacterium]|nr:MotA/TolQ/ExbB proton channel family protein [Pseudomonadota bacterium]